MSLARLFRLRHLGLPLIGAALTLLGCQDAPSQAAPPAASGARPAQARAVKVTPAAEQTTDQRVSATGTLAADEQVVLGTKVAGRVTELPMDLGSRLQRGQVVARLDPTDARLRVDQSVAALQQARARLGLSARGHRRPRERRANRPSSRRAPCSTRPSSRANARSASSSRD